MDVGLDVEVDVDVDSDVGCLKWVFKVSLGTVKW